VPASIRRSLELCITEGPEVIVDFQDPGFSGRTLSCRAIAGSDQHHPATGCHASLDVAQRVTDEDSGRIRYAQLLHQLEQHAGFWLPALAASVRQVRAAGDGIEVRATVTLEKCLQVQVDRLEVGIAEQAAADSRLIGAEPDLESSLLEPGDRFDGTADGTELADRLDEVGRIVVYNPVPVEQN